ncbi:uncharacterized protein cubi_02829 [Cryptosporidium ubiquitum]|uniref:Uncharacterized protein n=1 Tax=Cryptosporidium ubiquitum TaxID=857276 RepID=A0A1J4MKQ7_9CRYT|nr:uncharacterized protein cubi_02829 [Cryptosporidium ubiquitum]OII74027.1 hypothetical protein cubi_02829 [Cryptosporidium ubiquitum]
MDISYPEETEGKNPLKLNLANRVSEKLSKTGIWQNINVEWSKNFNSYIVTVAQVLFGSEQYLKLSTFIPLSDLDHIHTSFFQNLEQDSKEILPYINSKLDHQYVLAIVSNDDELILQSINFDLKKIE